ncbi:MAG TPA: aromatic-ring-hydroxylating dioxygenase subunit beta [Candidatus Binataceae bacterium]|nr:aromatic-ring-hydroxylating dioxygenase subunit beta [Candidatus Binataceae bacterium]
MINREGMMRLLQVQQWLYREARLLDSRRYDLWFDLLDDRIRYRVPSRASIRQEHVKDFATWAVERELESADALALIDDDLTGLRTRIERLQTGMAWAETPPSITRRLVSNVMILDTDADGISVVSTLFLAKNRPEGRAILTAERRDRLTMRGDDFRLQERYVVLDETILASENLSQIF